MVKITIDSILMAMSLIQHVEHYATHPSIFIHSSYLSSSDPNFVRMYSKAKKQY